MGVISDPLPEPVMPVPGDPAAAATPRMPTSKPWSETLITASRAGISAWLAVALAHGLGLTHPIYSLMAAVIVSASPRPTVVKVALDRTMGTAIGAVAGALVCDLGGRSDAAVAVCAFATVAFFMKFNCPEAAKLAGFVSGVVVLEHAAQSWVYALERFWETVLGIAAGYAVEVAGYRITRRLRPRSAPADSP